MHKNFTSISTEGFSIFLNPLLQPVWNYIPGGAGFSVWHDNKLRQDDKGIINNLGSIAGGGVAIFNDAASLIAYIPSYYAIHAGFDAGSFNQQQLHANQGEVSKFDANGSVNNSSSDPFNLKTTLQNYQPIQPQKINILKPVGFLTN